jgi:hypothetical protein
VLFRLYGGMNRSLDEICAGYTDEQLMLLADFLSRTTTAGRAATEDLSAGRALAVAPADRPARTCAAG